jgi:hypothetical protein
VLDPLPFRIKVPGADTFQGWQVLSIVFKVEGYLHLTDEAMVLEWSGTESVDAVGGDGIRSTVDPLPHEEAEVPRAEIVRARLRWPLVAPRLLLTSRRLGTFNGLPGARPGRLSLRIRRRDAALAARYAAQLDAG